MNKIVTYVDYRIYKRHNHNHTDGRLVSAIETEKAYNAFLDEKEIEPNLVLYSKKKLWNTLFHNTTIKHLLILGGSAEYYKDIIVFAVNRGINCYLFSTNAEYLRFVRVPATHRPDPDDDRNLIWEVHPDHINERLTTDAADEMIKEAILQHEAEEIHEQLGKDIQSLLAQTGVTLPKDKAELQAWLNRALGFVLANAPAYELDLSAFDAPAKLKELWTNTGSVSNKRWEHTGRTLDYTQVNFDKAYTRYVVKAYLMLKYYEQAGIEPDTSIWTKCPECGSYVRITSDHCPVCDSINTQHVDVEFKDFLEPLTPEADQDYADPIVIMR